MKIKRAENVCNKITMCAIKYGKILYEQNNIKF